MKKISIFYCKRIKDHSCIACANCFRGVREKHGEFAQHEEDIEIVSMTDCGDCPGNILPRIKLVKNMLEKMERKPDAIHLGTCVKMAYEHGNCPMDLDEVKLKVEQDLGIPVLIGTHYY